MTPDLSYETERGSKNVAKTIDATGKKNSPIAIAGRRVPLPHQIRSGSSPAVSAAQARKNNTKQKKIKTRTIHRLKPVMNDVAKRQ